ncbi:hypothetical protein C8J56DRAFT_1048112 [Mycena floridula]|nr:hypothetical protein C8J56DRAFT_1048112 [Mycena floridula]
MFFSVDGTAYTDIYNWPHDRSQAFLWNLQTKAGEKTTHLDAKLLTVLPNIDETLPTAPNPDENHLYPRNIIMTTPNADYMPNPFLERQRIRAFDDGTFGAADFTITPQLWFPGSGHLAWVLRRPSDNQLKRHHYAFFWHRVQREDLINTTSCVEEPCGELRPELAEMFWAGSKDIRVDVEQFIASKPSRASNAILQRYVLRMCGTAATLKYGRFFYRTLVLLVASFQRQSQECRAAWQAQVFQESLGMTSSESFQRATSTVMGMITWNSDVAQDFFTRGVPVWLLRSISAISSTITIQSISQLTAPSFRAVDWPGKPFPLLYFGEPSLQRTYACMGWNLDEDPKPKPEPSPFQGGNNKQAENSWDFAGPVSELLPSPWPCWNEALLNINTFGISPDAAKERPLGYRFPPPELLLRPSQRPMAILCWLLSRSPWISLSTFSQASPTKFVWKSHITALTQRYFSHSSSTKVASPGSSSTQSSRRQKASTIANSIFGSLELAQQLPKEVEWEILKLPVDSTKDLHQALYQQILWDLFEGNFRSELKALDALLMGSDWKIQGDRDAKIRKVFPSHSYTPIQTIDAGKGIVASELQHRLPFIEALRVVMSDWPTGAIFRKTSEFENLEKVDYQSEGLADRLADLESNLAQVYCQTFFDAFTRGPSLPRPWPAAI